ncbi:MAG TPA: hypothetical protein VKP66_13400 [Steroidobacteraceae bacterium]|nr:hypothetical protein [Steroidobacteraceae bacterium]
MPATRQSVPENSLLKIYRGGSRPEHWVGQGDCFSVAVAQSVSLSDFVYAFYTSPVFRIERAILRILAGAPSTDTEARGMADGSGSSFAIWRVGERTTTQLLMCDRFEKTRSWFQVVPLEGGGTVLRFGSAVATSRDRQNGALSVGLGFRWLMGFHVLYSRILLNAARRGAVRGS